MAIYSTIVRKIIRNWPGRRTFGFYSFLPAYFVIGAALEFTMIKWTPNGTNFYKTFKTNQAKIIVDKELNKVVANYADSH